MQNSTEQPMASAGAQPGSWYVNINGERKGPLSGTQVREHIAAGRLARDSLAWTEGASDWKPLGSTEEFARDFRAIPPPLSGAAIPNGLVWTLAFAPLIGLFVAGVLAGASRSHIDKFWWVTLVLNIGLSVADEKMLKAAGHDTKRMGAAWLVPVYLYKRATTLGHNLGYFIAWLVCFVLSVAV